MSGCLPRPASLRVLASVAEILLVLVGAFGLAGADTLSGRVYAPDARVGSVLFTWELERDPTTGHWRSAYRTLEGALAAEDEVRWDGDAFRSYRYARPPIGEVASVERRGGELLYRQVVKGAARERREPFDDRVTVGPTVIPWAQRHWDKLRAGQELTVRYAVLDQLRSFEFHLALTKEHPAAARGAAVVRMAPSNALLRLFVSPVYLVFSRDGRVFQEMIGRLLPVGVHGGKAHPIDGELVLHSGGG